MVTRVIPWCWAMEKIGGVEERGEVERELALLREKVRIASRAEIRLEDIHRELSQVWLTSGENQAAGLGESYADVGSSIT